MVCFLKQASVESFFFLHKKTNIAQDKVAYFNIWITMVGIPITVYDYPVKDCYVLD